MNLLDLKNKYNVLLPTWEQFVNDPKNSWILYGDHLGTMG